MKTVAYPARLACVLLAGSGMALPAVAQDAKPAPQPEAKPAPKTADSTDITVTGKRKEVTERIDRRVYDIKNDPESQTGMATDILAKLPSVQVSPGGKVSLRGDPGVTVLIDGKYPAGGAAAVQNLAAADIDRIEVMTNPPAQYGPEGTSGIINIITKRRHPAGISGNVSNRLNTQGQEVFGATAVVTKGPWSIDSRIGYIHAPTASSSSSTQTLPYVSSSHYRNTSTYDNFNLPVTVSYKLSDIDTLSLQTQDYMRRTKSSSTGSYRSTAQNYDRVNLYSTVWRANSLDFIYDRNDSKTGAHTTLDISHSEFGINAHADTQENYTGGTSAIYGDLERQKNPRDDVKGDYERRFDADHLLTAGFEWSREGDSVDRGYYDRGSVAGPNPDGFHRLFDGEVTISSLYTTFQMPLGKWTILPGLRAEQERHTASSDGLSASGGTTKFYPSLHLSHDLGKLTKLKLSYSRRVLRPFVENYDPGVSYVGRTSINIGNPALKPTDIDSYEAEVTYAKGPANYSASLYYRVTTNLQTGQNTVRSDGIIVYQPVNAGESHSGGAELTVKSPLSKHWKYSLSTNLYMVETPLFSGGSRDDFAYNLNGQVEYDAPAKNGNGTDQLQAVFNLNSRQYNPQGYTSGNGVLTLIWQHPLTAKVSMVVTAANLLQTPDQVYVTNIPSVQSQQTIHQDGQSLMFALAYKFGAKKK
ncbi:MAG TPA: TonB-dependent receptor [Asticcacaulis sp.]|nr:TonB-dependent receptor [Asticcacaulis sp.]